MIDNKISEMAAQEKREYFKMWRAANKDKVAKYNATYWEKKAAEKLATQQENMTGEEG